MPVKFNSDDTVIASVMAAFLLAFGWFLTAYIKQKGRNYADKKDIADITHKVEEVRNQYAITLTLLNANLSLVSKGIESFEAEAFKSFVSYHDACSYMLNDLANIDFSSLNIKNLGYLQSYNATVVDAYKRLRLAKANHDLFCDDDDLGKKAYNLFKTSIDYVGNLSVMIVQLASSIEQTDCYNKQLLELFMKNIFDERFKQIEGYYNEYRAEAEKLRKELPGYVTGSEFNTAIRALTEYQSALRAKIKDERMTLFSYPNI